MILFLILVGFLVGGGAAVFALAGGAGIFAALVAYSVFGAMAVLFAALVVSFAPVLRPRRKHWGEIPPVSLH